MSKQLKTAVIGVGHLGKWHADKYASHPDCDLIAVVDSDLKTAQEIAAKYNAQASTDFKDILSKVDAISLVVPTSGHFEIAKECLLAGVHCLVEKPITETLEEAQELVSIAREKNLVLQVGHIERFNSVMLGINKELDSPQFIESTRLAPFTPRASDVSVILDLMVHDIDIILDLIRSPIKHLSASGISVLTNEIDIANARIEFENGCVANVTASRISRKSERKLRLFQKNAYISADFQDKIVAVNRPDSKVSDNGFPDINQYEHTFDDTDALNLEVLDFVNAITTGSKPKVSGEDGMRVLETALAITQLINGNQ